MVQPSLEVRSLKMVVPVSSQYFTVLPLGTHVVWRFETKVLQDPQALPPEQHIIQPLPKLIDAFDSSRPIACCSSQATIIAS